MPWADTLSKGQALSFTFNSQGSAMLKTVPNKEEWSQPKCQYTALGGGGGNWGGGDAGGGRSGVGDAG